jgi:Thymidylate kinase
MIPHPPTTTSIPGTMTSLPASISTTATATSVRQPHQHHRGAFILLEGIDRCGKTTQCTKLLNRLISAGIAATILRFPDRTTSTGLIINQYLQSGIQLDDHAIHLLFSANRWENSIKLQQYLVDGTTVICDRYAYSGVAFSSAKVHESTYDNTTNITSTAVSGTTTTESSSRIEKTVSETEMTILPEQQQSSSSSSHVPSSPILDLEWCIAPDRGLPAPDCILFLDISQEDAEKRGGYVLEVQMCVCVCVFYSVVSLYVFIVTVTTIYLLLFFLSFFDCLVVQFFSSAI